jgi:hypothetical protein
VAGAVTSALFGRRGALGAMLALVGAVLATGLGGLLAGVLILPLRSLELVATALILSGLSPVAFAWGALITAVPRGAMLIRASGAGA